MKATLIFTAIFFVLSAIVLGVDFIDRKFFNGHWNEGLELIGSFTSMMMAGGFGWFLLYLA